MNKLDNPCYEYPCSHCGNAFRKGDCLQIVGSESCEYKTCPKDDLIRNIFIAQTYTESETDKAELKEMWEVFRNDHNGYDYDIYRYSLHHNLCISCDGSGVHIGAESIEACHKCNGTGVTEHELYASHYTPLWFVFRRQFGETDVISEDLFYLYTTRDEAERVAKMNSQKGHKVTWEIGELMISKNLIDLNDGTDVSDKISLSKVVDTNAWLDKVLVVNGTATGEYNVVGFGSWLELHISKAALYGQIAPYKDIEQLSSGRTILVRMDKMNQLMSIKPRESVYALYWDLLMSTIMVYCNNCVTYSGADELITKYCGIKGICKNWGELRSNVLKHVTTNNEGKVTDATGKQLAKAVQEDFRRYGILLPIIDAFGVIEKLASIMGEDGVRLNIGTRKCDALVVFIIEYICLSPDAEFINITKGEN